MRGGVPALGAVGLPLEVLLLVVPLQGHWGLLESLASYLFGWATMGSHGVVRTAEGGGSKKIRGRFLGIQAE